MVLYAVAAKEVILCKSHKSLVKILTLAGGGFLNNQGHAFRWLRSRNAGVWLTKWSP